jgi:hypothetical protein
VISSSLTTKFKSAKFFQSGNFVNESDLRAAPPVLIMWPCKRNFNEEKSKHPGSAQQDGFKWPKLFLQDAEAGERQCSKA